MGPAAPARVEPAPPAPIAVAARAFGDEFPPAHADRWMRVAAVVLTTASVWYVPWLFSSLNRSALWLAVPFAAANVFTLISGLVSVCNSWQRRIPHATPLAACGEPVPMILRTILSVLEQDWPRERLVIVVSDDGHDASLREQLENWPVVYY